MIDKGATTVMEKKCVLDWAGLLESATWTVKLPIPFAVGVPEILPPASIKRPGGRVPEARVQVYGTIPPVAAAEAVYGVPIEPFGNEVVLTARAAVTVRVND